VGEKKMVINTINDRLIKSGEILLKQLDSERVVVDAALWLFFPDMQNWKLLLSFPDLIHKGPKAAYEIVQGVLSRIQDVAFSLDDIVIAKPDASILNLMRMAINTDPGIGGVRFSNNVINGQLIQDSYIYRLTKPNKASSKQKISA
jgi:hypothetical protein